MAFETLGQKQPWRRRNRRVTRGDLRLMVRIDCLAARSTIQEPFTTNYNQRKDFAMPLARIDLVEGKSVQYRRTIADVVYEQMIKQLGVPADRFQVITEHKIENFLYDPDYLGIIRSENTVFIQLSFLDVVSEEQKESFYTAVVDELHEKLKLRREDVFFHLFTVQHADWSMGNGIATYKEGVPMDRLDPNSIKPWSEF